ALLENLQRENLSVIEEATAYQSLLHELHMTQEQLSERIGKSRSHIANYMRLLSLPVDIQDMITNDVISMGHGRALLGMKEKEYILFIARKIQKEDLNVRQVEEMVNELNGNVSRETKKVIQPTNVFFRN